MTEQHINRLILHLTNASVGRMQFTVEGDQEVCKPKYLLTRDRDFIVELLRQARDALAAHGKATAGK